MKTVIFACVHSAGRSQMAAAFFNNFMDPKVARGVAAGTQPAQRVHPEVVATMNEVGIDLSNAKPALLTKELAGMASLLVTMGCGENCPYIPGLKVVDWNLTDPKGKGPADIARIRDEIRGLIADLISKEFSK